MHAGLILLIAVMLVSWKAELIRDLAAVLDEAESREPFDNGGLYDRLWQVFSDHGIKIPDSTRDVLQGIWNMFTARNTSKTFTTANFVNQLACYQGRDEPFLRDASWANTQYNNYGCHCGSGKQHARPVDETDRCCKVHDDCYDRVSVKYGIALGCQTYTTQYTQTCCTDKNITKCNDPGPSAGRELCECDQAASKCFSQPSSLRSYSSNNRNIRNTARCSPHGEVLSVLDLLKSCKHFGKPIKTFKPVCRGQGECPKEKTWWW